MSEVGLKDLLQAGVHFGHQTHRWNPKMRKYIFAERGGIYLIDLKKTLRELNRACDLVNEVVRGGNKVLFVCTKPQLKGPVRAEAERAGAFYVTERWLGGMLTNFQTMKKNIRHLKDLERGAEEGAFEFYTKKERLLLDRERGKLERYLSGIKDMTRLPGLVFVVDANKEDIAVREANRLGIPVVAIADTNANPDMLTIAIAGNDDAIRSVSLITGVIVDEILMARREAPEASAAQDEGTAFTYSSDVGGAEAAVSSKRKRPKRRPRPELIKRRLHASDPEAGSPEAELVEAVELVEATISGDNVSEPAVEEVVEIAEVVATTAETDTGEDGEKKDPGSP
ncbi:MAG: 30S ribosomal protein S2 [Gemmatimonadetes bacterium]|nr:30S ribosomal protein S2 [Gemmatimonadota bacterium]